jgi:signal transduction histidine kinase
MSNTTGMESRGGIAAADLLETRRVDVIDQFEHALLEMGSRLVGSPEARAQLHAQANGILEDVFSALRGTRTRMAAVGGTLSQEIGRSRASRSVHPNESLSAATVLFDIAARIFVGELAERSDSAVLVPVVLGALHRSLVERITTASVWYVEYLLEHIHSAHTDERQRISRELHDRVAHGINVAFRSLELCEAYYVNQPNRAEEKLLAAKDGLEETLNTIREINAGLRTRIAQESLQAALHDYYKAASAPKPDTWISVTGDEAWILPEVRDELFLTLREAIRNVFKHAQARALEVRMHITPYEVRCTVTDDGVGFDPGSASTSLRHVGLLSMRERVELLRGDLVVESRPDDGTRLDIIIPLAGTRDAR